MQHLRRQRDLRHQKDRRAAPFELLADQVDIDARLAAAGHAEEQRAAGLARSGELREPVAGSLLLRVERGEREDISLIDLRASKDLALVSLDELQLFQSLEGLSGRARVSQQIAHGKRLEAGEQIEDRRALRRAAAPLLRDLGGLLGRHQKPRHLNGLVLLAARPVVVEPKSRGQDRLDGLIDRTEEALAHEQRQADLIRGQDRLLI